MIRNSTIGVLGFCPHNPPDGAELRYTEDGEPIIPELPDKGKRINKKSHCKHGHSLDDAYVYNNVRVCRECVRIKNARRLKTC